MIFSWFRDRRRKKLLASPFPEKWNQYLENLPFFSDLNADEISLSPILETVVIEIVNIAKNELSPEDQNGLQYQRNTFLFSSFL